MILYLQYLSIYRCSRNEGSYIRGKGAYLHQNHFSSKNCLRNRTGHSPVVASTFRNNTFVRSSDEMVYFWSWQWLFVSFIIVAVVVMIVIGIVSIGMVLLILFFIMIIINIVIIILVTFIINNNNNIIYLLI